ncbi:MAG TPA: TonB-dependent receptor [Puia sp.]|nr:TonB-dependent receptor [Puia sp.]
MIKRLLFSAITILSILHSFGQETTSQMLGTVTDGKQVLGGASVEALHVPTGTKYTTTTRKDGRYNLSGLRIGGPYVLTVTYVGFKAEKLENIVLTIGQDYTGDFTMTSDTRELTAATVSAGRQNKIFNNSHTGAQELISRAQIEQLPTVGRSIQDFTKLEPTSNGLSFAGTNPGMNNITVDGADFNNSFGLASTLGGQANAQPIALDALDQIQVQVSPYDVRQGNFTGALVNSVTRSGTNKFRGTIYTYLKGPGTIGYKADDYQAPKTPFTYNVSGASFGGAIIPDKLFFFVNAEQSLQTAPATGFIASDANHPVTPGSVSQANADTLTALAGFLKSKYNYDPGAFQSYSFKTNSYKVNARLDWNINPANVLTLKYNYLKSYADQFPSTSRAVGSGLVGGQQPGNNAMPFYGAGYRINNDLDIYILELNTRFGNTAANKLQVGYTRERDFRTPQSSSTTFPLVDILFNNNGYTTFGYEPFTYNNTLNMDSYQLMETFTYYKGSHEITVGTQDTYKKYQNAFAPGYQGVYQFASLDDFLTGKNPLNYRQEYSTLKGGAFPWAYAGATNLSLYAQDKWRASPNFTLVYGIRFDYTTYQNKFTDNPNFDQLTFKNGASYNIGAAPSSFVVVSPRVGFNWDVLGDRSLQVRGGAGIFEGAPPFVWVENQASTNGVLLGTATAGKGTSIPNFAFNPNAQGGLNAYLQASGLSQTSTPTSYSADVIAKNFKYPTKLRASIGIDKKLPDNWVVTAEFIYSKDINATYMANLNLNESNAVSLNNGADNRSRYTSSLTTTSGNAAGNFYYNGAPTASLQNPTLQNAIWLGNTSKGYSYQAILRIQKNIRNFSIGAAYTYSDSKTAMENGSTASSLWSSRAVSNTDPNAAVLARPSWYQPHRVIAYGNYRFEYAKHLATIIGVVFEAAPSGVTNYVYNGDLNGDGNTGNDLIYIPKSSTDIHLINSGSYSAVTHTGSTTGTASDPRNAAQIWTQLNNYITQDHYLYNHRGHYVEANSVVQPFFKRMDLHVGEDIYFFTGRDEHKQRHTLSLTMDMLNVGNFISKFWGVTRTANVTNFLKFEGMSADGRTPLFSFTYQDAANQIPLVNSFAPSTSLSSRWQAQFGIRYEFN